MEKKVNSKLILSAVAACLMSTCAIAPFAMMSLYMEQMSQSINTTVGAIAIALSVSTVGSLVASLLVGKILKVLGHRIPIIIAGILIFAFQYTLSVSQSIVPIYIVAFFNGFGTVWGGIAMAQIIIAQWFKKGMGTMMSVCMVVMGIVLTVTIPLIGSIIATVGYRQIVLIVGIVGGAGVILSALLASGAPEKYGLKPYGAVETDADAEGAAALSPSLPFNKILKTTVFWAILLIVLLGTIVAQGFSSQAAVVFGTFGLDAGQAALAFGIFTFLGLPWQFTFGILCDKIGPKLSMTICAGICSVILAYSGRFRPAISSDSASGRIQSGAARHLNASIA